MKRIGILMFLFFAGLFSSNCVQAQIPNPQPSVNPHIPHFPRKPTAPRAAPLLRRAEVPNLPALVTKGVIPAMCSPDAQAFGANLCGYVNVPLDRRHPSQGTIPIYFELYLHSGSGPAVSALLVNFGGPGVTTSGLRSNFFYVFGANLDVHDLLLIDDRGRGLSGTIDCQDLQHVKAQFLVATAECAAQLGNAASRYGTGDIADDTDAVRSALGYDKVDYYGGSYGGADVSAYATRYGKHLRSIVLDAPFGTPDTDQAKFVAEQYRTHAEGPTLSRQCQRSLLCSSDHRFPDRELDALIWTVRRDPVEGDAYNANGKLMHVRIDEEALLNYLIDNPTGNFVNTGEVLAAAFTLAEGSTTSAPSGGRRIFPRRLRR